jgi:hypothetical protein
MELSPLLILLVGGVLLVVLGTSTVARGRRQSAGAADFVSRAVVTEAEVTDLRLKYDQRMADRPGVFHPVVRFALPDGRRVEAETLVGAHPAPARPGQRVPVRYDPQDPERVVLAKGLAGAGSVGCMRTAFGVALAGVGLFFVLFWFLLAVVLEVPV